MGKTVETEALDMMAKALSVFILSVKEDINKMQNAAVDCQDNMGGDKYSSQIISNLAKSTVELEKTLESADVLRQKIIKKKQNIEALKI